MRKYVFPGPKALMLRFYYRARKSLRHFRCGWHSGFPLCCILWFVLFWNLFEMCDWFFPDNGQASAWAPARWDRLPADYIRCPLCLLTGRVVPARKCECSI